jgi:hypothetical protein
VTPSRRLRRNQVEDGWIDAMGCIRPYYPYFDVFYVLGSRDIIVFSLLLGPINMTLDV